jgi:hypothetical protein
VLVEHVSFAGHGSPSSHITVCPFAAVQFAGATHETLEATPVVGSSVTQQMSPGGAPSAAQSAALSHGIASEFGPVHPDGTVHTADELVLEPLVVTQQMSVVASHELLPHWMDAFAPDELPELDDDELDDEVPPELDELLLLLDDLPPDDDELLDDDFPPDDEPELDPPPELDDADVPFSGPSKSAVLVAPPHAATADATSVASAPTMHPLQAMTAKPM